MVTALEEREAIASPVPISSETVGEVIRNIEARYDLLQYEVDGWCVWPVFRCAIATALMDLSFTGNKEPFTLRELLFLAAKDLFRLLFAGRSRYVVLTLSSELMEQESGRFKNVYFDDLLRELGSFFKVETLNNKSFLTRRKAALMKSNCTTTAFGMFSTLILPKFRRHPDISRVAVALSADLRREPGLEAFSSQLIGGLLEGFYWRKKLFSWLLGRIRPDYLFTADGYSDHAAIAAAKEKGIKVCEFQHGGFIESGPEYGWTAYAANYKTKMPIPDRLFLFGDYWKEQLEGDGFWGTRLQSVGSPRMDQYRRSKSSRQVSQNNAVRQIVLTTQGIDTEKLISFMDEFLRISMGKSEIDLYVKLHPAYESDKEVYESLSRRHPRVKVILGSEEPSTFALLSRADLHLSISSASHYDALGLGVPTVILPLANCGWVLPLYRRGDALMARTPNELLEIVQRLERYAVPESLSSYYFKPDALENLKRALAE